MDLAKYNKKYRFCNHWVGDPDDVTYSRGEALHDEPRMVR